MTGREGREGGRGEKGKNGDQTRGNDPLYSPALSFEEFLVFLYAFSQLRFEGVMMNATLHLLQNEVRNGMERIMFCVVMPLYVVIVYTLYSIPYTPYPIPYTPYPIPHRPYTIGHDTYIIPYLFATGNRVC